MKRIEIILAIVLLLVAAFAFSSCSTTKKDCKDVKHYKQKGGFYLHVKTVGEAWDT